MSALFYRKVDPEAPTSSASAAAAAAPVKRRFTEQVL